MSRRIQNTLKMSINSPQLDLKLHTTDNPGSPFYAGKGEEKEMTGVKMQNKTHEIHLVVSKIPLRTYHIEQHSLSNQTIPIPYNIYRLTYSDTYNSEQTTFEIVRDHWKLQKKHRSFLPPFSKTYRFLNTNYDSDNQKTLKLKQSYTNKWDKKSDILLFENEQHQVAIHFSLDMLQYDYHRYPCNFGLLNTETESLKNFLKFRKKLMKRMPDIYLEIEQRKNIAKTMNTNSKGQKI